MLALIIAIGIATGPQQVCDRCLENFIPKIPVSNCRFVYSEDGNVYTDFLNEYRQLAQILQRNSGESANNRKLSSESHQWVVNRISEGVGDDYAILFFPNLRYTSAKLAGIELRPSGDGGVDGLWGCLVPNRSESFVEFELECVPSEQLRPIGITIPVSKQLSVSNSIECQYEPTKEDLARIEETLIAHTKVADFTLNSVAGFGMKDTWYNVFIGSFIANEIEYLFVLDENKSNILEFPESAFVKSGCVALSTESANANDMSPINGKYYVLPDIDGNCLPEIVVISTVSQLFTIEGHYNFSKTIVPLAWSYFGP